LHAIRAGAELWEGAGEDAFLGSAMAEARVRGFQGADYSAFDKVLACAKHFAAYGAAEAGRDYNTVDMSETHAARSLPAAFKAAKDAGAGSL
jgi:beta-glucosidase